MNCRLLVVSWLRVGFWLAFLSSLALGQQARRRDVQALDILTRSLSGAGDLGSVQDFSDTGMITYYWAGEAVQGPVTVHGKGLSKFRMDSSVSGAPRSLVMSANPDAGSSPATPAAAD